MSVNREKIANNCSCTVTDDEAEKDAERVSITTLDDSNTRSVRAADVSQRVRPTAEN